MSFRGAGDLSSRGAKRRGICPAKEEEHQSGSLAEPVESGRGDSKWREQIPRFARDDKEGEGVGMTRRGALGMKGEALGMKGASGGSLLKPTRWIGHRILDVDCGRDIQ